MSVFPVGFGMNTKLLMEHDRIPNQMWPLFPYFGGLLIVVGVIGFVLILMSAFVTVRQWANSHNRKSKT